MFLRKGLPCAAVLILAVSVFSFAQESQPTSPRGGLGPRGQREGRHHEGGRRAKLGLMRELNLTEDQKQQQRAVMERHLESIKAPREELFRLREKRMQGTFAADDEARAKELRQEIHNAMQRLHSEVEGILTAEQLAKLEQLKTERKARHERMREPRQDRRQEIPR